MKTTLEEIFGSVPGDELPPGMAKTAASASIEDLVSQVLEGEDLEEKTAGDLPPEFEENKAESEEKSSPGKRSPAEGDEGDKTSEREKEEEEEEEKMAAEVSDETPEVAKEASEEDEGALRDALTLYFGHSKTAEEEQLLLASELVKTAEGIEANLNFGAEVMAHAFADELQKVAALLENGVAFEDYLEHFEKNARFGLGGLAQGARGMAGRAAQGPVGMRDTLRGLSPEQQKQIYMMLGLGGGAGVGLGAALS